MFTWICPECGAECDANVGACPACQERGRLAASPDATITAELRVADHVPVEPLPDYTQLAADAEWGAAAYSLPLPHQPAPEYPPLPASPAFGLPEPEVYRQMFASNLSSTPVSAPEPPVTYAAGPWPPPSVPIFTPDNPAPSLEDLSTPLSWSPRATLPSSEPDTPHWSTLPSPRQSSSGLAAIVAPPAAPPVLPDAPVATTPVPPPAAAGMPNIVKVFCVLGAMALGIAISTWMFARSGSASAVSGAETTSGAAEAANSLELTRVALKPAGPHMAQVQFTVVNHSPAKVPGRKIAVTVRQLAGEQVAVFAVRVPEMDALETNEVTAHIATQLASNEYRQLGQLRAEWKPLSR